MRRQDRDDGGLTVAIAAAGTITKLAKDLGLGQSTVASWKKIPVAHVLKVEQLYRIPRGELRPDVYPPRRARGRQGGRPRKPWPPL